MTPGVKKLMMFLIFLVGAGIIYPLVMSGIFKLSLKTSITIGIITGITGGILWVATSNAKEKRKAERK